MTVEEAVYETAKRPQDDKPTLKDLLDLPPYFIGPGDEMLPVPPPKAKGQLWHIKDGALVASLHVGQSEAYTAIESIVAIIAGAQSGKALALDTPIPTPAGYAAMGDVKVGDYVLDQEGRPTQVLYVSPIYRNRACFRVTFSDGTEVVADAEHNWAVGPCNDNGVWPVLTTRQIDAHLASSQEPVWAGGGCAYQRQIVGCNRVDSVPVRCIAVASPRHVYLCTRAMIPTHNTSFGPVWLEREIGLRGPGDYLCVSPTVRLSRLKMIPEFLKLFDRALKLGTWHKGDRFFEFDRQKAAIYFENPAFLEEDTRVIFGSAVNPESLESATAKAAWLDEAGQKQFRLESWEAIQRRLVLHQGRCLITTTPYGLGWLKQSIYDPWMQGAKHIRVVTFTSDTNPAFPKGALDEMRRSMPAWRFALFYLGQFQKPEGLIYSVFKDTLRLMNGNGGHVVRDFDIPVWWPRYVGIDFGGQNTATVWLAQNPDSGELFIYRETLKGGITTNQHAQEWKSFATRDEGTWACSPDVADELVARRLIIRWVGGAASEEQYRRDYRAAGIPIMGPPSVEVPKPDGGTRTTLLTSVEVGISRTLQLFTTKRLYVFESCKGVRAQLTDYGRVILPDGTPSDQIDDKAKYHFMDALRYVAQRIYNTNLAMPDVVAVASVVGWQPEGVG